MCDPQQTAAQTTSLFCEHLCWIGMPPYQFCLGEEVGCTASLSLCSSICTGPEHSTNSLVIDSQMDVSAEQNTSIAI